MGYQIALTSIVIFLSCVILDHCSGRKKGEKIHPVIDWISTFALAGIPIGLIIQIWQ